MLSWLRFNGSICRRSMPMPLTAGEDVGFEHGTAVRADNIVDGAWLPPSLGRTFPSQLRGWGVVRVFVAGRDGCPVEPAHGG